MATGTIFDIKRFAIHDGPGIRTTVFFKGCTASCWWCHNPESRDKDIHVLHKNIGNCIEEQIIGKSVSVEELLSEIQKDRIFFDESGGGVTFSGGEPLFQAEFLLDILKECRKNHIHTALDTTGYSPSDVFNDIAGYVDLILYDLKFIDDQLHQQFTGISNQFNLQNFENMLQNNKSFLIRFPAIPDKTMIKKNIKQIVQYLKKFNNDGITIHILPYHRIATQKYKKFDIENKMQDVREPSSQEIQNTAQFFRNNGFKVKTGG